MKTLSSGALQALADAVISGQTLTIVKQLDRPTYLEVNLALETLGGKWSKKLKAHVFDAQEAALRDSVEAVVLAGGFTDKKQELGFFPTPAKIADEMVRLAKIGPGHTVLEPSAGHGAILDAIKRAHPALQPSLAVEIDPTNVAELRKRGYVVHQGDFLDMAMSTFPRIIMNPPFKGQADIDHVLHAWKMLAPGGRLVAVMSAGVTFRENNKTMEFRMFVKRYYARDAGFTFYNLPEHSFAESGTNVSAVLIVLGKP